MAGSQIGISSKPAKYFISPLGHPRDRIIIHETADIPKEGQFMQLNGYAFLAKPNVELDLPRPVRLMLDTRIRTETIQGRDGQTYTRNIPRITYTLVKMDVGTDEPLSDDKDKSPVEIDPAFIPADSSSPAFEIA